MITLENTLKVSDIVLDIPSESLSDATAHLLNLLRHDKRITNWGRFVDAMGASHVCVEGALQTNFCIPHARTNAVQNVVVALGRSPGGIDTGSNDPDRCHYVFLFGIPAAMAADYLRLIGAVARIFRQEKSIKALNAASTPEALLKALIQAETSL